MMATTNLLVRLNRCRMKSSCRSKTTIEDTSRILRSRLSPTRDHRPRSGPPSQRSRNPPDPTLPRPSAISPIPMGRSSSTTPPMAGTTAARRLRLPADRDPWSPLQVTVYMAAPAEHGTKAGYSFPDTPREYPNGTFPARSSRTLLDWINYGENARGFNSDVASVNTYPNEDGAKIVDAVGGHGLIWGGNQYEFHADIFGYPSNLDGGEVTWACWGTTGTRSLIHGLPQVHPD